MSENGYKGNELSCKKYNFKSPCIYRLYLYRTVKFIFPLPVLIAVHYPSLGRRRFTLKGVTGSGVVIAVN